jgi:hypothetical protein
MIVILLIVIIIIMRAIIIINVLSPLSASILSSLPRGRKLNFSLLHSTWSVFKCDSFYILFESLGII